MVNVVMCAQNRILYTLMMHYKVWEAKGEVKVAEWIREASMSWTEKYYPSKTPHIAKMLYSL